MIARLVFGAGLAATLAILLAIPDFAPLKRVEPAPETQHRLAFAGLWRIGMAGAPDRAGAAPVLNRDAIDQARVCASYGMKRWRDVDEVDVARLSIAVMAAEAVSRPGWRQIGEFVIAEGLGAISGQTPDMTYGPLQIRASRVPQHDPGSANASRDQVLRRLEDPCFSLAVAASLLVKALQDSEGLPEEARVLAAAAEYSGYRGAPDNYAYSAMALSAYRLLADQARRL
ncbi:hypothetical protein ACWCOP_11325 [Maricaulaceae bacterium MS644]